MFDAALAFPGYEITVDLDRQQTAAQRQQEIDVQARENHAMRMG